MACCCGSGSGSASALPILTGAGQPVTPPDPTTHLPLYRDVTTGYLWLWSGGTWSVTRAPIDWMIGALVSTPLQPTDFITINRGGTPGNPDSGTYYVTTVQDLAAAVGSIVGATTVSSADAAIDVTVSGSNYAVGFNPQGGAAEIAGDATALATLFGAATLSLLSDVSSSVPNVNDALVWNGSAWAPVPLSALTNDSFVNGGSITGGGTTLTLTYNTAALPPVNINVANIVPNYDNTTSGLSSTNMQAAIDELAAMFGGNFTNVGTGTGVYAGFNSGSGFHEFYSIDGANGVSVSLSGNTITVQFDPGSLTPVAIQQLASMIAGDTTATTTIAGAIRLGDLADVNTAGATNGDVLTYQSGQWMPAAPPAGGGGPAVEEVLQGICADCFDDALAQGLSAGDYWLNTGTNPPMLFQWDGANLNGVSPLPDIFVCCNSFDVYVQCSGQMVGAMAVGPELAHMVMTVVCAATEADAIAAGLQAHQYWLDTSATPPHLMHYNGTTSTPATFTPKVVMCCNTGDVYIRCESGAGTDLVLLGSFGGGGAISAANVQVIACPVGPINTDTDLQTAICALSGALGAVSGVAVLENRTNVGQTFNAGAWTPLNLTGVQHDGIGGIVVSGALITLPPGTYDMQVLFGQRWVGSANDIYYAVRVTDGTAVLAEAPPLSRLLGPGHVVNTSVFTLTATTQVQVEVRPANDTAFPAAFGTPAFFDLTDPMVFDLVKIMRLG